MISLVCVGKIDNGRSIVEVSRIRGSDIFFKMEM
jgi:hypothetical protein